MLKMLWVWSTQSCTGNNHVASVCQFKKSEYDVERAQWLSGIVFDLGLKGG